MDRGHRDADKELRKLERKLKQEYEQAYEEMQAKAGKWLKQFEDADAKKLALVKAGELDNAEYQRWRATQMVSRKQMDAISDQLSRTLTEHNQVAAGLINGSARSAFISNYNYGAFEVCKAADLNLSFQLVDEKTIGRLLKDNPKLLPKAKVDVPKDLRWNQQKLRSAITQGILQGDDIPSIAKRLRQVTDMSNNASVRNARTMTTSAENGGRMASYEEASEMGIEMQKTWIATIDDRTRDAHVELDGVSVDYDAPFENSIGKIMYPADPDADPENVYNCRCTIIASLKGHKRDVTQRKVSDKLGDMSYDEWKAQASERVAEDERVKEKAQEFDIREALSEDVVMKLEEYTMGEELYLDKSEISEIKDAMIETEKPLYRVESIHRTAEQNLLDVGDDFDFSTLVMEPKDKAEGALRSFTKSRDALPELLGQQPDAIIFETVGSVKHLPIEDLSMYSQDESLLFSNKWIVEDIVEKEIDGKKYRIFKIAKR